MNIEIAKNIAKESGTPFYILDHDKFTRNVNSFKHELQHYYENIVIGYSFKTNYTPSLCGLARDLGCYAEVVSTVELLLAKKLKFDYGKCIFNGPIKTIDDIILAIDLGAIINFDHINQIQTFLSLPQDLKDKARIGLRINIDLNSKLLAKKIAKGGILPRFGIERSELGEVIENLNISGFKVLALHGHCSSSDRAPENYATIARELMQIREEYSLNDVKYVNLGGGFAGEKPNTWQADNNYPSFKSYAESIFSFFNSEKWFCENKPVVIIEPGMSVVANAMCLVTSIVSQKSIGGQKIFGVDANFYNVRPTLHEKPLPFHHIQSIEKDKPKIKTEVKAIVGGTCMERDILLQDIELESPDVGDLIAIDNVGAYCSVLTPNFICFQPPIYDLCTDQSIKVSRKKQDFESFFSMFKI